MKKVLFTLAMLFAVGFAYAQAPQMVISSTQSTVTPITEISLAPGESQEVYVALPAWPGNYECICGFQIQWRMYDAEHNLLNSPSTSGGVVAGEKVVCGKVYGGRTKTWTEAREAGTTAFNEGNAIASVTTAVGYENSVYRIVATNTTQNVWFWQTAEDGVTATTPCVWAAFTVMAAEDWADEYATLEEDYAFTTYNVSDYNFDTGANINLQTFKPTAEMACNLTIKNKNFAPATIADPVISFSENGDVLTVTVSCATEGATLYVNGVAVETENGVYTYTVNRTYADQTVNVTAYATKGDLTSETVTDSYVLTAKEKETVAAPVISYETTATQVIVTVTWPESDGDQVYTGQYTYDRPAYGQADQSYDVEAYVTEGATCKESAHATKTIPVPAQEPVWQDVAAPVISYETTATQVIVTVTWPTTTGDQVYTGQYTYDRPAYGEADQSYDVEAYTTESYPYRESAHATKTIPVPAQDPNWIEVNAPVISYETTATQVIVTVTWPTTTGDQVYTGQYTYDRPAYGEADQSYDVEAYTTENYPYRESAHATKTIPVPAQDPQWIDVAAPVITYQTTDDQVIVTVTWPTTTGDQVYTGQYTYDRPAAGLPDESYDVTAYTTENYPYRASAVATATIPVPAKVATDPCVGPGIQYGCTDLETYTIVFTAGEAGETVYYTITYPDGRTVTGSFDGDEYPNGYEVVVVGPGYYAVQAYATKTGYTESNTNTAGFTITAGETTGMNEMNAGKSIANIRYFNMAGQEMQEANGMTIVVTTYTDGTSSAVKVMK